MPNFSAYIYGAILMQDETFSINKKSEYKVYHQSNSYLCGDSYNVRKYQQFVLDGIFEDREYIKELIFLIKSLKMTRVFNIRKNSFIFGPYKRYNTEKYSVKKIRFFTTKFTFRLCRYTRTKTHIDIVLLTNKMIREGVLPINALLLSHIYLLNSNNMYNLRFGNDVISSPEPFSQSSSTIYLLYKSKESFISSFESNGRSYGAITSFYKMKSIVNKNEFMQELNSLLKDEKYLEAESFYIKSGHVIN